MIRNGYASEGNCNNGVLSLLVIASMAVVEARLLQGHFFNSAVKQVKNSAEQLAGAVVELDVAAEDNETCREVAFWVYYNTGMRVLVTNAESTVVVDSSLDGSLQGESIVSELLKSTIASGETHSFDLPQVGQDQVAISVPWRSSDGISGSLILVGPLKSLARDATDQLKPFILKSGLGGLLVALVGSLALSPVLTRSKNHDADAHDEADETQETEAACTDACDAPVGADEATGPHGDEAREEGTDILTGTDSDAAAATADATTGAGATDADNI